MKVKIKALVRFGSFFGCMSKGDIKEVDSKIAESLVEQGLVELVETKPEPKAEIETKPQSKKKGKGRK